MQFSLTYVSKYGILNCEQIVKTSEDDNMRADGKKVKNVSAIYRVVPHIMTERHDSMNMITLDIPVEPIQKYLRKKAEEGVKLSHMMVILAAYVRTVAEFPALNRFVANRNVYAHKDLTVSLVVLKNNSREDETMNKIYLDPADTIFDVQEKVGKYIDDNRKYENSNSTDKIIDTLLSIPGLLRFGVAFLKWLDKHGWLPNAIIKASPFHASFLITNLASIRTNHIFHHVYDFGTTSISMALGNMREVPHRTVDGTIVHERCIPAGMVMDERIASGSYFALAFRVFKRYLKNPELLEEPPKVLNRD